MALSAKLGEVIGEAWDNGTGLDIGPELEKDTATTGLDRLMPELKGKIETVEGEITLGP